MVGDSENGVKTLRDGEISNEVHGHCVEGERLWSGGNGMKRDFWLMGGWFGGLAGGTAPDVRRNKGALVRPPIVSGNRLQGSVDAGVSCRGMVMVGVQYLSS
jgi:hypothetical protein